ncbi:hypothetical protein BU15DRAFT_55947, partial [Melanogaster broomeanus]
PHIHCGRSTPPLPIAIQCLSTGEAKIIQRTLQPLLNSAPGQRSSTELLSIFGSSPAVRSLLDGNHGGFFPVAVGTRVGVYRTRSAAAETEGSFDHPLWRHTDTLWEALAYMIVKGVEDRMPPLMIPDDTDFLTEDATPREPTSPTLTPNAAAANSSKCMQPSLFELGIYYFILSVDDGVQGSTRQAGGSRLPVTLPPLGDHTPIIYSHVHSLRGVIESHYYFTPDQRHSRIESLGLLANQYLEAHGYLRSAALCIAEAHSNHTSAQDFALHLSCYGLPVAEGRFLWALIDLQ